MKTKDIIRKSFDDCAKHYEQSAKIQQEIGQRLFERLDYLKIKPKIILDLGCGTGAFSALLQKRYKDALIIGLDFALSMLKESKTKQPFFRKWALVNADMMHLPIEDQSVDLVFVNQVLHWSPELSLFFKELNRVMRQDGCLLFSTLGPDTFKEINTSFANIDQFRHTNAFIDMHDIGDQLLKTKFLDPVVDMEFITLHYPSLKKLILSLKDQGVKNINEGRNKGLTGKTAWDKFATTYKTTEEGKYPLTYEVIYGHAWKGRLDSKVTEIRIPLSQIKQKKS